jgi:methylmalonyl-CoA/ethylmalonyl-CoA epimerase
MSNVNGIHHINFVVKSLQPQVEFFSRLLNTEPVYGELGTRQVRTARFYLNGIWIVLVEPLCSNSEVGQLLEKRGEGMFLLSFAVDSIADAEQDLELRDIQLKSNSHRQGLDDWQVCDVKTPSNLGAVIQLCMSSSKSPLP